MTGLPKGSPLRAAEHYDAELFRHNERLRAATGIGPTDQVLDIGCGFGQSTRDAARAAPSGSALGVDVCETMLERARRRTAQEQLSNVSYELGDAQVHRFRPAHFDVVISRFGTMFFGDPVAAFTNIARATRPGARLVMMVWQCADRNEWASAIHRSVAGGAAPADPPDEPGPFSLGDPSRVRCILGAAGFTGIGLAEIHEPVYYGPDIASAYELVRDFKMTKDLLAGQETAGAERALDRLRDTLAAHCTSDGVFFDSRAWIVTARRSTK
ncbi:class I SAM-dependent methyltransferase [Piscinibacter sp. XHJ-5]|uniref:class I SAM-dependent methyltransferase n=1 Tax=Piscinibacter sp. XHJ-5 TaxID=3037797 RepID=UPI00245296BF|nr:class I SAM-dependent methyltransferase [Piscinibacter sp. XHJ-5]